MFSEFIKSDVGIILLSIIWGLGLSTLFKKVCINKTTETCKYYEFKVPDLEKIKDKTWKFGNKCYKFEPYPVECM